MRNLWSRWQLCVGKLNKDAIIVMNKSGTATPIGDKVKIHIVPAEHSSSLVVGHTQNGEPNLVTAGAPVGYVVKIENGVRIYHSGDTGVFGDMALIGRLYKPGLAMIYIGSHFTTDGKGAGFAMSDLMKPKKILPIHYGTFPVLKGTPQQLKEALENSGIEVLDIKPGQAATF